jgi:hypothetical protein
VQRRGPFRMPRAAVLVWQAPCTPLTLVDMNAGDRTGLGARVIVVCAMLILTIGLMLCTLDSHHHMPGHPMSPELCNGAWLSPEVLVLVAPVGALAVYAEPKQSFPATPAPRLDPPPRPSVVVG